MKVPEGFERFTESIGGAVLAASESFLRESVDKAPKRVREAVESGKGWWVPISFYNKKNLNGRNYNRKLWENVRDKQKRSWYGSMMLCDHPAGDSDGNPKDVCGVWLDMKLGEPDRNGQGLVWALLVPVGRNGQDLRDVLENGGRIGTSSSGFGRLLNDGETVDPDTYQIDRCADWVMCPSQSTFFGIDDEGEIEDRSIRESLERTVENTNNKKDTNNYIEHKSKENKMSGIMSRVEEKRLRKDIEACLEEAISIQNAQERLEGLKEVASYCEDGICPDLKEKVLSSIKECEEFISAAVAEKAELKESFGIENPKDLERKLTQVVNESKLNEKEAKDWKAIAEGLQDKLQEAREDLNNRHSDAYVNYLKGKTEKLTAQYDTLRESSKEQITDLQNRLNTLNESLAAKDEEIQTLKESKEILEHKIEESQISEDDYLDRLAESKKISTALRTQLEESTKKIDEANAKLVEAERNNTNLTLKLEEMKSRQGQLIAGAKALKEAVEKKNEENAQLNEALEEAKKESEDQKAKFDEAVKNMVPKTDEFIQRDWVEIKMKKGWK